jgi:hypothetical protein
VCFQKVGWKSPDVCGRIETSLGLYPSPSAKKVVGKDLMFAVGLRLELTQQESDLGLEIVGNDLTASVGYLRWDWMSQRAKRLALSACDSLCTMLCVRKRPDVCGGIENSVDGFPDRIGAEFPGGDCFCGVNFAWQLRGRGNDLCNRTWQVTRPGNSPCKLTLADEPAVEWLKQACTAFCPAGECSMRAGTADSAAGDESMQDGIGGCACCAMTRASLHGRRCRRRVLQAGVHGPLPQPRHDHASLHNILHRFPERHATPAALHPSRVPEPDLPAPRPR